MFTSSDIPSSSLAIEYHKSLIDGNNELNEPEDPIIQKCLICGYKCPHKNYNVYCCNGCAAFFRRTIKQSRTYTCARGKRCRVEFGGHKRTCRFCRFERCLEAGMSIAYVLTRHGDWNPESIKNELPSISAPFNDDPNALVLKKLFDSFSATFINRRHAKSRDYKYEGKLIDRGKTGLISTMHSVFAEFDVMLRYLRQSGIQNFLDNDEQLITLGSRVFYNWFFMHSCWVTLRNSGHRANTIYFSDESCVDLSATDHGEYVASLKDLIDPNCVARSLITLHNSAMSTEIKFHNADIDMNDLAFMSQIVALQAGVQLYPWKSEFRQQLNTTFKAACAHYDQNYSDVPVKFGNLIFLINETQQFNKEFKEWVVILTLNGCKSALEQILESWTIS